VFKRTLIEKNRDDALEAIAMMYDCRIIDLDREIALIAAELSFELKLPMADSIILAIARAYDAILWTLDEHLKSCQGSNISRNPKTIFYATQGFFITGHLPFLCSIQRLAA
jgi:predicted nucleic acid-binding protein